VPKWSVTAPAPGASKIKAQSDLVRTSTWSSTSAEGHEEPMLKQGSSRKQPVVVEPSGDAEIRMPKFKPNLWGNSSVEAPLPPLANTS